MKAIFLTMLIVILMFVTVSATDSPIDMGSTLISGSGFLSIESRESQSVTTVSLMPTIGYFASPGFMIGGTFSLMSISTENASVTAIGIGPQGRYYLNSNNVDPYIKGKMYPFLGAFFSYVSGSGEDEQVTQFGGIFGFNQMMSDHLSTEFQLRFFRTSYGKDHYGDNISTTTIYLGLGFSGFLY